MSTPFVLIIIVPTFNDSKRLQHCLRLLESQTYPKSFYKAIVVDNNSSDDVAQIVAEFEQASYAFEPIPRSYNARNQLLSKKGKILGFTDSDYALALDWIEQGVAQILAHPDCGLITRRIDFSFQNSDNPTPVKLYDSLLFLQQKKYIREGIFGATANLFATPEVFEAVGVSDATLKSEGDREWGKRVYAAGYTQIYADSVAITHPARADWQALIQKLCRVHRGDFQIKKQAGIPFAKLAWLILLDLKPPARYLIEILKNDEIKDVRKRISVVYIYMYLRVRKAIVKLQLYRA